MTDLWGPEARARARQEHARMRAEAELIRRAELERHQREQERLWRQDGHAWDCNCGRAAIPAAVYVCRDCGKRRR